MKSKWTLQLVYPVVLALIVIGVSLTAPFIRASVDVSDNQYDDNLLAGTTTTTYSLNATMTGTLYRTTSQAWGLQSIASSSESNAVGSPCSKFGTLNGAPVDTWYQYRGLLAFYVPLATGTEIKSVKLRVYCKNISGGGPADWGTTYFGFYKTINMNTTLENSDWSAALSQGRIMTTAPRQLNDFATVDTWYEFNIYTAYLKQFLSWRSGDYLFLTFSNMRSMMLYAPTWSIFKSAQVTIQAGGPDQPQLIISYIPVSIPRVVYVATNAGKNPMPFGTETADNMTWGSPRCAYSDETIYFKVYGDSGANITLRCIGSDGTLLATQTDEVRVDGLYNWSFVVPSTYSGWIRAYEDKNGLYSTWGYIDRSPSPTMLNLTTYAYSTSYPQYDNPFSYYSVYKDGLMFVYWASNIVTAELGYYNLGLWVSGNTTYGTMFSENFTWMADSYYNIDYTSNRYLAANRYAIYCPQIISSGFNNGDGLVYNLNREYDMTSSGFIVPVIYDNVTGAVIAECHSAYYYLQNSDNDGVKISTDTVVEANKTISVYINVGAASMIPSRLSNLTVQLIDSLGYVYNKATGFVTAGVLAAGLTAPSISGIYQIRCTFYDTSISPYYSLVLDKPVTVSGGTTPTATTPAAPGTGGGSPTDWLSWFSNLIKKAGLDNEPGHWLIIFILCIIWVAMLRKNAMALTIMICLTVGSGLIFKWLNPWFYVLLAIGAGIIIFGLFKKKTHSSSEG